MSRIPFLVASVLTFAAAIACHHSTFETATHCSSTDPDFEVSVADYDSSCDADSECVLVAASSNACEGPPCCSHATLNADAAVAYNAYSAEVYAKAKTLPGFEVDDCSADCVEAPVPTCVAHACVLLPITRDAGPDANASSAGSDAGGDGG